MTRLFEIGAWVGRYFSLVSALPSAILVTFVFTLASSGAWSGPPDWGKAGATIMDVGFGTIAAMAAAALVLGLALHPLQFLIVQLYEGYWGVSSVMRRLAFARTMRRRQYLVALREEKIPLRRRLKQAHADEDEAGEYWLSLALLEMQRLEDAYPRSDVELMPTRLGNVLRRHERDAGAPYGLEAIPAVPHLALVAPDKDVAYLDNQRYTLDLAVRMSVTALLATMVTCVFLWDDGLWMLLALIPYALSYLLYRGAIVTAGEYGTAMSTLIALNRFALYDRLGLPRPGDSDEEQAGNKRATNLLLKQKRLPAPVTYDTPWRDLLDPIIRRLTRSKASNWPG